MKGAEEDKNGKKGTFPQLMSGFEPITDLENAVTPWTCWSDTLSLDSINYTNLAVNPFFNISFLDVVRTEYFDAMTNEWYIYGSSTHGRFARAFPVGLDGGYDDLFYDSPAIQSRHLKQKQYKLKDHLGNVRVVLSDMKLSTIANDSVAPFRADVLAAYSHWDKSHSIHNFPVKDIPKSNRNGKQNNKENSE